MFFKRWSKGGRQLIDEVSALERPKMFHPRRIDEIVRKYICEGMSMLEVKKILAAQNLKIHECKIKSLFPECVDCDEGAIAAGYNFGSMLSFLPARHSMVIDVGFKGGRVAIFGGWYVTHAY